METIIRQGVGGSVSIYHYDEESRAAGSTLSNVTCMLYYPDGSVMAVEETIYPQQDGRMSIQISAEQAGFGLRWCRAHFQYTYQGESFARDIYFHIEKRNFDIPFHYEDLEKFLPNLADYAWEGSARFAGMRQMALEELYSRLAAAGIIPERIINLSSMKICFAYLWLSQIFRSFRKTPSDHFEEMAADFYEQYAISFNKLDLLENNLGGTDAGAAAERQINRTKLRRA